MSISFRCLSGFCLHHVIVGLQELLLKLSSGVTKNPSYPPSKETQHLYKYFYLRGGGWKHRCCWFYTNYLRAIFTPVHDMQSWILPKKSRRASTLQMLLRCSSRAPLDHWCFGSRTQTCHHCDISHWLMKPGRFCLNILFFLGPDKMNDNYNNLLRLQRTVSTV